MKDKSHAQTALSKDYSTTVTILEHLSDALFILNPKGAVEYANGAALDMLGLKLNDILGRPFNNYLNAAFDAGMLEKDNNSNILLENIYRGIFNEIETSLVHKEYRTPVIISFGLVRNAEGKVTFIIASAKDITIRKKLEKEIQQQQLIALSRDRYKELGELAVNMVHNLSQPITSIHLMIELMQKQFKNTTPQPEKFQRYFDDIIKMLDTMSNSISHVRNFAFLTEDESVKSVSCMEIINSALKQLEYEINDRNIVINVSSQNQLPPVMANPISLQQVFITLLRFLWTDESQTEEGMPRSKDLPIQLEIQNIDDRWLKIVVKKGTDKILAPEDETNPKSKPLISAHLDLTVVQIILTSIGGDFSMQQDGKGREGFILRIPVDKGSERDQLRNLIEMMHK